jgi:hypothetical protein
MDLNFTPDEQEFREKTRAWVRDNLPREISDKVRNSIRLTRDDMQRWAKILARTAGSAGAGRRSSAARAGTRSRSTCSRRRRARRRAARSCRSAR